MKNKLEPWEEGLAGRMKEHEFSFDPAAMAGFESLLAAETTVAGEAAPRAGVTPAPSGGGLFSGKLLGLLLGALVAVGLLFYSLAEKEDTQGAIVAAPAQVTAPATVAQTTEQEVEREEAVAAPNVPVPLTTSLTYQTSHPAAAAPLNVPPASSPKSPPLIGGTPPSGATFGSSQYLPRPMPTTGSAMVPRQSLRAMAIPALPSSQNLIIAPLLVRPLPGVRITPEPAQMSRDRNALFPEIIDKN